MSLQKKTLIPRVGVASLCSPLEVSRRPGTARLPDDAGCASPGCRLPRSSSWEPSTGPSRSSAAGRKLAESHVHAAALVAASWFEDYLVFRPVRGMPGPAPAVVAAGHGDRRTYVLARKQLYGLLEATRQRLPGRLRTPWGRPTARSRALCVSPGRGARPSLAAGADRTGRPSPRTA